MYEVPTDIDLTDIVGSEIQQICLGRYQVQFRFDSERVIDVEGNIEILEHDIVIANWNEEDNWSNTAFQKLFNVRVKGYSVPNNRTLDIQFEGNLILRLYNNSETYESIQIYPEEIIM